MTSVEIYGKPSCGYCNQAKKLCEMYRVPYKYYDLSVNESLKETLIERMGSTPKTVPQIFVDGEYKGGYTEFYRLMMNKMSK